MRWDVRCAAALLVVASVVVAPGVAHAEVQVGARLDKTRVEIGEPFVVTIVATAPKGHTLDLAPTLPLGEAFDELERVEQTPRQLGADVQEVWTVTLVALEAGALTVPPLPVLVVSEDGSATQETSALSIEVTSVIGDGPGELRPIAAPVTIWRRDLTALWIALGALAALVLLVLGVRALRRRSARVAAIAEAVAATPPADVVALRRLRAVEDEVRTGPDPRPAHFQMSEIVREYLGRRLEVDALEQTTDELAATLAALDAARLGPFDDALRGELLAWLAARDLIKFARVGTHAEETLAAVKVAVTFVERTRAEAAPAEAQPPTGGPRGA